MDHVGLRGYLLEASLLCGMRAGVGAAHRLQLFFVANRELQSRSHESDFQRAIETGVDREGLWENHGRRGSGEYVLTALGYQEALQVKANVVPRYTPVGARHVAYRLSGIISGVEVELARYNAKNAQVYLDQKPCGNAREACDSLSARTGLLLSTVNESAVRIIYNLAVDYTFNFRWDGPKLH